MKIKHFFSMTSTISIVSFIIILVMIVLVGINNRTQVTKSQNMFDILAAVRDIQAASDFAAEQVRLFANTGNTKYSDAYNNETQNERRGQKAINVMDAANLSDEERTLMNQIKKNYGEIAAFEKGTVELAATGYGLAASKQAFSDDYLVRKDGISSDLAKLSSLLKVRMDDEMIKSKNHSSMLESVVFYFTVFLIGFQVFLKRFTSRKVARPLEAVNEAIVNLANGNLDQTLDLVRNDTELGQLAKAYDDVLRSIRGMLNGFSRIRGSIVSGNLRDRGRENAVPGAFNEIVIGVNDIIDSMQRYLDHLALPIMVVNLNFELQYVNEAALDIIGLPKDEVLGHTCHEFLKTSHCNTMDCCIARAIKTKRIVSDKNVIPREKGDIHIEYTGVPILDEEGKAVAALEFCYDTTETVKAQMLAKKRSEYQEGEVRKVSEQLNLLSRGRLDIRYEQSQGDRDTEDIFDSFSRIADSLHIGVNSIKANVNEVAVALEAMADKNFDVAVKGRYQGDFERLKTSIVKIIDNMNDVLSDVASISDGIEMASDQIASVSQKVSVGSQTQALAVTEILEAVKNLDKQAADNASAGDLATDSSARTKESVESGDEKMAQMVAAMDAIKQSSDNIAKVMRIIDDISFQTNILALNAAVEAARAGSSGRGFAIVAEEVRSLAGRSASATRDSEELISASIRHVNQGSRLANETKSALDEIFEQISQTQEIVSSIATASKTQEKAISDIKEGLRQIAMITEQNSAEAQTGASATQELSSQFKILHQKISEFQLR